MFDTLGQIFDEYPENLKVISTCPICNGKYYSSKSYYADAKILDERDHGHLLHIQCKRCKSCVVALIMSNGMGVSSVSLVTDLTSHDVMKFRARAAIQMNDIIDLHKELMNNTKNGKV